MTWRLSLLMFLLYAPLGAMLPLYSLRLQKLGFTPAEVGWACATQAMAAVVAPLLAGQVADRWFSARRCLAVCAALAGVLLWILAAASSPAAVFAVSLAFWMVMGPAVLFGTSLSFALLHRSPGHFGRVRLWGTVGWVIANWMAGYWFGNPEWLGQLVAWFRPGGRSEWGDLFRLGGLLAFGLALYALTLPHTPPQRGVGPRLAPLAALHLLRNRPFAVCCACLFAFNLSLPFAVQTTPLLLDSLGIEQRWLGPTLTVGQATEVASLALLPLIHARLGLRGSMVLGLAAWALALSILTLGRPTWLAVGSLGLNGVCICCFLVTTQIYVNGRARGDVRASAQGLLTFTNGLGMLAGNLLVGWVREEVHQAFAPTFAVGAAIALGALLLFLVGFTREAAPRPALGVREQSAA